MLALLQFACGRPQEGQEEATMAPEAPTVVKGSEIKMDKANKESKSESAHQEKLSASDRKVISEVVSSVKNFQTDMMSTGVAESSLRSRLEALMTQTRAAAHAEADTATPTCPPPGFNALSPFSVEAYINGACSGAG